MHCPRHRDARSGSPERRAKRAHSGPGQIDPAKAPNDHQRQQDEIEADDRVGDEGVEGFVGEIVGRIQRIAHLPERGEAGKEHQRGGVKQENRFVCIGGPAQPQHGRPLDTAELLPAGNAIGIGGLEITLRDRAQRAIENLG
jgi:hypothetical protein